MCGSVFKKPKAPKVQKADDTLKQRQAEALQEKEKLRQALAAMNGRKSLNSPLSEDNPIGRSGYSL